MSHPSKYTRVVLSFKDVFPEEERQDIASLINDIPSNQSLEIVAHLSARFHANELNQDIHIEILNQWIGRFDSKVKEAVYNAFSPYFQRSNFAFINQPSCLYLIQEIISNYNNKEYRELTSNDELKLFKAYLIASEWSTKVLSSLEEKRIKNLQHFVELALRTQLPISNLKKSREFFIQSYKAILFFQFCSNHDGFNKILDQFIRTTSLSNWNEYLESILSIYTSYLLKFDKPNYSKVKFSEHNHVVDFLSKLSLDPVDFTSKNDFISIREKPVFKIGDKKFLFLNIDFFIDKIFSGILFDIYSSLKNNRYGKIKTNDFATFKSSVGDLFTEKKLFYEVMNYIKKDSWVSFTGDELSYKINGSPDYYIRRRSKVFLFECKDSLIRSDVKNSYSYEEIEEEIVNKLIQGKGGKNKGLSQLLSFIVRIRDRVLEDIDDFETDKCKFYPILVVTDQSLNEYGVNYIINLHFNRLVTELKLKNCRIQYPVIVHMDDIIRNADIIKEEYIKLNSIFDDYISYCDNGNHFAKSSSFNSFLMNKTFKYREMETKLIDAKIKEAFR